MKIPVLLLSFLFTCHNTFCFPEHDSLYNALKQESNPEKQAAIHQQIGNFWVYDNGDSARKHYISSLAYYSGKNDTLKAACLRSIAMSLIIENNLDSAIHYSLGALEVYKKIKDSLSIAHIENNLGLLHINIDQYEKGTEYLIEALSYKESLSYKYPPKKLDIASTELNIGIALNTLGKYDRAIDYYKLAQENYFVQEDTAKVWRCEMQIANAWYEKGDYEKAEPIYRDLLSKESFANDPVSRASLLHNFATLLYNKGNNDAEAEQILNEAYELNIAQKNKRSAAKNKNNIAEIYLSQAKYNSVIEHAKMAFKLADEANSVSSKSTASRNMADAYAALGKYKDASIYYKMHAELNDEHFTVEKNRIVSEMEAKYDSEKKQQQIETLNAQQEIKDLNLKQKTTANILVTIALLMTLLLLFIIVFFLRKVNKQKQLLNEQNAKLIELNNGLQKMFAIISHDLRNFVNGFKNAGKLIGYYQKKGEQEKLHKLSEKLNSNSQRLDVLLDNLLNWGLSQSGLYELNKQEIHTSNLVNKQIEMVDDVAKIKGISLINDIPESHICNFDNDNLTFIIRNLLSNALKFTAKGEVRFYIQEKNKIMIQDSGTGMSEEKVDSLFTIEKGNSTLGTSGEKGSGLGLKLVNDFVILNGAKLSVASKPNKGTCFCIDLNNEQL